jgi:zinc transport system permease protein
MMAIVATLLGIISVILGIYLSVEIDAPSGPSIVVVSGVLFFISHIFAIFIKKQ